jgi:DNA polymerase-3 subunit chi
VPGNALPRAGDKKIFGASGMGNLKSRRDDQGPSGSGGAMTEIFFYHLRRQPIENVLPALLEKSLERGWRAVVQAVSEERIAALDAHLWTYRDDAFLPHGTARDGDAALQPVLLTTGEDNPNGAEVRFIIDGAAMPADAEKYQRLVLLFDGDDEEAVTAARGRWRDAKLRGFVCTYWQCDEQGRWRQVD